MKRTDYLSQRPVIEFSDWLARRLDDPTLLHGYTIRKPPPRTVTFRGLPDALVCYEWHFSIGAPMAVSGRSLADTANALDLLKRELVAAVSHADDSAVCEWAKAVMKWGGVTSGNVKWLERNQRGLAAALRGVKTLLESGDDDLAILKRGITRFNSGMTKVYSLLVQDFAIYDSRVAGALAWFVLKWCQSDGRRETIPPELAFACMPAKEDIDAEYPKIRNPSFEAYAFPHVSNRPALHAHWNLRASWVLARAIELAEQRNQNAAFSSLRDLEAALFMWGYDLPRPVGQEERSDEPDLCDSLVDQGASTGAAEPITADDGLFEATTRGHRARHFKWRKDADGDRLSIIKQTATAKIEVNFTIAEVFRLIHCVYDEFGDGWVPLANSVQKVPAGTEKAGFGTLLYDERPDVTRMQCASQLVVVLEHLGLLKWDGRQYSGQWRLHAPPPQTIDELRALIL